LKLSIARNSVIGPYSSYYASAPARKNLHDIKIRYFSIKKAFNKYNNVFVKEFKLEFLSLELKRSTDFRKLWADKIIDFLNTNIKWKYPIYLSVEVI
jgi:hypothetical protein